MGWRLANSLRQLRDEVNEIAPDRDRSWDGTIGDEAHQRRDSDHNPNEADVVTALDLTHDPGNGADMHAIADEVLQRENPCLKYVIFDGRIASANSNPAWSWRGYDGHPHGNHMHVSVGDGLTGHSRPPYDDESSWGIADSGSEYEDYRHDVDMGERNVSRGSAGDDVAGLQRWIGASKAGPDDGYFGPRTEAGVRWYQSMRGIVVDGIVGPQTWGEMGY